jgi:phosphonatase-like hydrolase
MVVFDMAGTTVDENNIVYKTLQRAISEGGFHVTLEQVLSEGAGKEKLQAVKSILKVYAGKEDNDLAEGIYRKFMVMLEEAYKSEAIFPQKHALELFRALKERKILVILNTGYDEQTAQSLVMKLGWKKGNEFDGLITAASTLRNRPDPDMIQLAMKQSGIMDPREVIKVGDSTIDILEGKNAGCLMSIGITTGAHSREQLLSASPDYVLDDLLELLPLIDGKNRS